LFSDVEVPRKEWGRNFREMRRLNFIESINPSDYPPPDIDNR
jgi:hypothetical protein